MSNAITMEWKLTQAWRRCIHAAKIYLHVEVDGKPHGKSSFLRNARARAFADRHVSGNTCSSAQNVRERQWWRHTNTHTHIQRGWQICIHRRNSHKVKAKVCIILDAKQRAYPSPTSHNHDSWHFSYVVVSQFRIYTMCTYRLTQFMY